jgi:PAS domain S-box-containing protein
MANENISAREREVVRHAAEGLADKEIAVALGVKVSTIQTYWERVRAKTQTVNRAQAIAKYLVGDLQQALDDCDLLLYQWNTLIEHATDYAVFNLSPEGVILDWNVGIERLLGFNFADFVGQEYGIIFPPDDAKAGEPKRELDEASVRGRCLERRFHVRKDGTQLWVVGSLVAYRDKAGRLLRYSKILRDESTRKSMEDEIHRLTARIAEPKA